MSAAEETNDRHEDRDRKDGCQVACDAFPGDQVGSFAFVLGHDDQLAVGRDVVQSRTNRTHATVAEDSEEQVQCTSAFNSRPDHRPQDDVGRDREADPGTVFAPLEVEVVDAPADQVIGDCVEHAGTKDNGTCECCIHLDDICVEEQQIVADNDPRQRCQEACRCPDDFIHERDFLCLLVQNDALILHNILLPNNNYKSFGSEYSMIAVAIGSSCR